MSKLTEYSRKCVLTLPQPSLCVGDVGKPPDSDSKDRGR